MNIRHERLRELIAAQFNGSQAEFCRRTGLRTTQVNQWLKDYRVMGEKSARLIEQLLGLPKLTLDLEFEEDVRVSPLSPELISLQNTRSDFYKQLSEISVGGYVPLISWVQAGDWRECIDTLAIGEGERIATAYKVRKHTYALKVQGDSMQPKFPSGCILIVEPEEDYHAGSYVIVRQKGDVTFKQLIQDGSKFFLKPLNPNYPIMELDESAEICGVVKRIEMDV